MFPPLDQLSLLASPQLPQVWQPTTRPDGNAMGPGPRQQSPAAPVTLRTGYAGVGRGKSPAALQERLEERCRRTRCFGRGARRFLLNGQRTNVRDEPPNVFFPRVAPSGHDGGRHTLCHRSAPRAPDLYRSRVSRDQIPCARLSISTIFQLKPIARQDSRPLH